MGANGPFTPAFSAALQIVQSRFFRYNNGALRKVFVIMQNKPLLSGFLWRIALWIAFAILLIAIGYGFAMLVTALNNGMQV